MNISLFTLTESGYAIGQKLAGALQSVNHQHRPEDFKGSVAQAFKDQQALVFVCATGIVIRTLAPLLEDKHTDPPVVVIDDKGKNVIPLLGGHEGGADILAREISEILGANYVVTSATDYSRPVDVIGIGSDRNCPPEEFKNLLDEVSALISNPRFRAVASIDIKSDELGMVEFATGLGLPFITYPAADLRAVEEQLSERSEIVFNEVGCYGVAEAAALVHAGKLTGAASELVVTKHKTKRATLAIARSYQQEDGA